MERLKLLNSRRSFEYLFFTFVIGSFICWLASMYFWKFDGDQWSLFFRNGDDFFADMSNIAGYSALRDTYHDLHFSGLEEKAYPPLSYIFAWFISKAVDIEVYYELDSFSEMYMDSHFLIVYLSFLFIGLVLLYEVIKGTTIGSNITKILMAFTVIFSMPMLYTLERGNTIITCLTAILVYIFFYDSEKKPLKEIALIAFGVAVAIKMTPAVLGILMLYDKKYKEAIRGTLYSVAIFFLPFLFFTGGFSNVPQMFDNVSANLEFYSKPDGCSLAGIINSIFEIKGDLDVDMISTIAYIGAAVLLLTGFLQKSKWKRVLSASLVLIVLPSHSGFYSLIFIFPAVIMFLNEEKHRMHDWFYLILFGMTSATIYCMESYDYLPLLGLFILLCYHVVASIVDAVKRGVELAVLNSNSK